MSLFWEEGTRVMQLALPAMGTSMLSTLMLLVDSSFVGHIGPGELAAAALGNACEPLAATSPFCTMLLTRRLLASQIGTSAGTSSWA